MLRGSSQLVSDLSGVSDVPYMWPTSHREVGNKLATSWRQLNYGFVTNKLATSRESRGETTFVECGHKFRSITLARLAASISRVSVCLSCLSSPDTQSDLSGGHTTRPTNTLRPFCTWGKYTHFTIV